MDKQINKLMNRQIIGGGKGRGGAREMDKQLLNRQINNRQIGGIAPTFSGFYIAPPPPHFHTIRPPPPPTLNFTSSAYADRNITGPRVEIVTVAIMEAR